MYSLLVADDEGLERKVLLRTLKENFSDNAIFYEAKNGREAVEFCAKYDIDIAILDIEMPGVDGLEAAMNIKHSGKNTEIIFLTAYDDFNYAKVALKLRAVDYLLKPWNEEELIVSIETAMHFVDLYRQHKAEDSPAAAGLSDGRESKDILEGDTAKKIRNYITENYMKDISLADAAEYMNYSEAYFSRLFKQMFHMTFTSYLADYRMKKAKIILENTEYNVKAVGEMVGFSDSNYFTKVFKRKVGISPSEYKIRIMS